MFQKRATCSTLTVGLAVNQTRLSHPLRLLSFLVSAPKVSIFGDRDVFVEAPSSVHIKCVISQSLNPPNYIEWRHDGVR